jgi:catechol 2,3-dioxygenase-like lactoylglutathione lyase family enzyme
MARFVHASFYVDDLAATTAFYTDLLGLKVLQGPLTFPNQTERVFIGRDWEAYLELVADAKLPAFEAGTRYRHIAVEIDGSLVELLAELDRKGIKSVTGVRSPTTSGVLTAIVQDPNGVQVELVEKRSAIG